MANDLFKTVNYNDGEGATHGDQNDAQRYLAARLNDQLFEKLIGSDNNADPEFSSQKGANASTAWAYCLNVGGANPKQGTANNKVKIGAGTLFQKLTNATGNEPTLLAYTFDGTDELTLANGDATNPRVDMIQMALAYASTDFQSRDFQDTSTPPILSTQSMNKKRVVSCTLSIKQGTPAASPTYPTPDAGNVPIACVVVGATYSGAAALKYVDSAGATAVLHDLRMPLRIRPVVLRPQDLMYDNGSISPGSMEITSIMAQDPFGSHTAQADRFILSVSPNPIEYPIPLPFGCTLVGYTLYIRKRTGLGAIVTAEVWKTDDTTGVASAVAFSSQTNSAAAAGYVTLSIGLGITLAANNQYYLKVTGSGSVAPNADETLHLSVQYTIPQNWMDQAQRRSVLCNNTNAPNNPLLAPCRVNYGRVVGVAIMAANGSAGAAAKLVGLSDGGTDTNLSTVTSLVSTGAASYKKGNRSTHIEGNQLFSAGPTVLGNGTHYPPVWANGKRSHDEGFSIGSNAQTELDTVGVSFTNFAGLQIYGVTFYIAEGM